MHIYAIIFLEVFFMYVKIFDEEHEHDLEIKINDFFKKNKDINVIDIKYQIATLYDEREQIYCYSCMIVYDYSKLKD